MPARTVYHEPDVDHAETWVEVVAAPLDDEKAAKREELDALNLEISTTPFAWDFTGIVGIHDDGTVVADLGPQTLQIESDRDQANWTAVGSVAGIRVLASQGGALQKVKTSANYWAQTTASQAFAALVQGAGSAESLLARQERYLERYGQLKRAIENAADSAALAAIDITAGW